MTPLSINPFSYPASGESFCVAGLGAGGPAHIAQQLAGEPHKTARSQPDKPSCGEECFHQHETRE